MTIQNDCDLLVTSLWGKGVQKECLPDYDVSECNNDKICQLDLPHCDVPDPEPQELGQRLDGLKTAETCDPFLNRSSGSEGICFVISPFTLLRSDE